MLALCQSFECPRAVLLPLAQPRLAVAYPAKLVLFVSGVTSAPPSLLSSEHLPLLMFRKCCFVIDRTSCCGFVTCGSKFTFGDLPLFPTSQDHQLLILPQYTCPTTTRSHVLSVHCKCGRKCVFARHTTCWIGLSARMTGNKQQIQQGSGRTKTALAMEKRICCLSEPLHTEGCAHVSRWKVRQGWICESTNCHKHTEVPKLVLTSQCAASKRAFAMWIAVRTPTQRLGCMRLAGGMGSHICSARPCRAS